jgi:hypothetical protein
MATQVKEDIYRTGFSGVSASDVGNFLNVSLTTAETSVISELILDAEDALMRDCRRNFQVKDDSDTDIEYKATANANINLFYTYNYPIKKVTRIDVDGVQKYDSENESTYDYRLGEDFFVENYRIEFDTILQSSKDVRNSVIIYYTLEDFWGRDIKTYIKKYAAQEFMNREYGGKKVNNFNIPQLSVGFDSNSLKKDYAKILKRYKKVNL